MKLTCSLGACLSVCQVCSACCRLSEPAAALTRAIQTQPSACILPRREGPEYMKLPRQLKCAPICHTAGKHSKLCFVPCCLCFEAVLPESVRSGAVGMENRDMKFAGLLSWSTLPNRRSKGLSRLHLGTTHFGACLNRRSDVLGPFRNDRECTLFPHAAGGEGHNVPCKYQASAGPTGHYPNPSGSKVLECGIHGLNSRNRNNGFGNIHCIWVLGPLGNRSMNPVQS